MPAVQLHTTELMHQVGIRLPQANATAQHARRPGSVTGGAALIKHSSNESQCLLCAAAAARHASRHVSREHAHEFRAPSQAFYVHLRPVFKPT